MTFLCNYCTKSLKNMQVGLNRVTMEYDNTLAGRVKYARSLVGLTQEELARKSGLKQSDVSKIENGRTRATTGMVGLAKALNCNPNWLDTGRGDPWLIPNTRIGPELNEADSVPLISFVQAGNWCEISNPYEPGVAEEWFPCPAKHGPRAYCLTVEGESMFNPFSHPSYEPGSVIFVDPDRMPLPGDRVIVRLENEIAATFKQYMEEGSRRYLKALNPEWKPRYIELSAATTICGVVIGKWVRE